MTLDEIFANWSEDSKISKTDLDNEALKIPLLHSKYLKLYTVERMVLIRLEAEYKQLYKLKNEYFSGSLDLDTIKEKGWQPNPRLILKADLNMHIDADEEIQKLSLKIGLQREKVSTLDSIIKTVGARGFQISNAINYMKLMNGVF